MEPPSGVPTDLATSLGSLPSGEDASLTRLALHVFLAPGEPGEPPDWLKVLAIPLSFFLITIRFLGHTVAFSLLAARGEILEEGLEVH